MKPEIIIVLIIGTAAMFGIMAFCRKWYSGFALWKLAVASFLLTVAGTLGAYALFFVENGKWGGISFYGSLFVIPVLFIPVARVLKVGYGELLDICAPSVAFMLALNKVNCVRSGCCKGMVMHVTQDGTEVRFPSQIVELCVAVLICAALIFMMYKGKMRRLLYPTFLLIYGVLRFGLNLLRETTPFIGVLPAGNFWSIIAIAIGIIWIILFRLFCDNSQPSDESQ